MSYTGGWEQLFRKTEYIWTKPHRDVANLAPLLKSKKFHRILDLGCGYGRHTVYLAKKGFFVTGSDISPTALKLAQIWLRKEKLKDCCLVEHDMTKLPFPDEHFDAVISINVIHHDLLDQIKRTVDEIRRVLRKGGLALIAIASTNDYKLKEDLVKKEVEPNTYIVSEMHEEKDIPHHFFDKRGAEALFSKFKIISIEEIIESFAKKPGGEVKQHAHWLILAEK